MAELLSPRGAAVISTPDAAVAPFLQTAGGVLTLAATLIKLTTAIIDRRSTFRERPANDTELTQSARYPATRGAGYPHKLAAQPSSC